MSELHIPTGTLEVFAGPMKSNKSDRLIERLDFHSYAEQNVIAFQPQGNLREDYIKSRSGRSFPATKVESLTLVDPESIQAAEVIGLDEPFMLPETDSNVILSWLNDGKRVYVSTLDVLANGNVPRIYTQMQKFGARITQLVAACEICNGDQACGGGIDRIATHTIIKDSESDERMYDLPDVVPERPAGEKDPYDFYAACFKSFFDEEMERRLTLVS